MVIWSLKALWQTGTKDKHKQRCFVMTIETITRGFTWSLEKVLGQFLFRCRLAPHASGRRRSSRVLTGLRDLTHVGPLKTQMFSLPDFVEGLVLGAEVYAIENLTATLLHLRSSWWVAYSWFIRGEWGQLQQDRGAMGCQGRDPWAVEGTEFFGWSFTNVDLFFCEARGWLVFGEFPRDCTFSEPTFGSCLVCTDPWNSVQKFKFYEWCDESFKVSEEKLALQPPEFRQGQWVQLAREIQFRWGNSKCATLQFPLIWAFEASPKILWKWNVRRLFLASTCFEEQASDACWAAWCSAGSSCRHGFCGAAAGACRRCWLFWFECILADKNTQWPNLIAVLKKFNELEENQF